MGGQRQANPVARAAQELVTVAAQLAEKLATAAA